MNVYGRMRERAEAQPDAEAVVEGRGRRRCTTSFGELDAWAAAGAAALGRAGLKPGDAVLVLVPVSAALYAVVGSLLRRGLVVMLLDPGAGLDHVRRCCRIRPPDAFVGSPKAHALRLLVPGLRRVTRRFVVGGWAPRAARWPRRGTSDGGAVFACDASHPALLTFTSGSTGQPKAAVRTHGLLAAQQHALATALELGPGQRDLASLPVFVLANLASGVTTVLADADLRRPGVADPARLHAQVARERPTRCAASPAFVERLLEGAPPGALVGLARFDVGGAPVFPDLLDRLSAAAPGATVCAVYGSTEAEPIAELSASDLTPADRARVRAGGGLPAGRPGPSVRLAVIRDQWGRPLGPLTAADFAALACAPDAPGEIVVAGPHVVPGYLDGVGDDETKIEVDGERWHRTGDAGTLDVEGRLWLLGRCAAAARAARGVTYPLAVEAAIRGWPGVRRAAFVASGERGVLAVEPTPGGPAPDAEALRAAVPWAHLDAVRVVPALPMDRRHNAKVDYPALRALLGRAA